MSSKRLLARPDLLQVIAHFEAACAASRAWDAKVAEAIEMYGLRGPQISGCHQSHYPEAVKDELRALAWSVSDYCNAAYRAKPPRVRRDTICKIGRAVARRDGSGFYGPQP